MVRPLPGESGELLRAPKDQRRAARSTLVSAPPKVPLSPAAPPSTPAPMPVPPVRLADSGGGLLERLAGRLDQEGLAYCQWMGHWSAHRWSTGRKDVDFLVDHACRQAFRQLVEALGFKLAHPPGARRMVGSEHYLGFDPTVNQLLQLHVHYRLLLGDYWKPVYHIPIERPLLDGAVPGSPFRVPGPTYQYLVFVLRMMLRQVGRPLLSARTLWTTGIRMQLESLQACSSRDELAELLRNYLTPIDLQLFDRCVRSLLGGCGPLERAALPWELHRRLRAHVRLPSLTAMLTAAVDKVLPLSITKKISDGRLYLSDGGMVLALVGEDGAGKSTCARELNAWLGSAFRTMRSALGDPRRSWLTLAVDRALKLEQQINRMRQRPPRRGTTIELLRHVCTARDRYRQYVQARRFAVNGGIAICEGYPIPQNGRFVGSSVPEVPPAQISKVAKMLSALEATYCERILRPDAIVVLQLDPQSAVGGEPKKSADPLRGRSRIIGEIDWSATGAETVDANQPLPDLV